MEIALALSLLAVCGLLMQSFFRLTSVHPGFDSQGLISMNVDLPAVKYLNAGQTARTSPSSQRGESDHYRIDDYYRRLLESIRGLPGVVSVGGITRLPLNGEKSFRVWAESLDSRSLDARYSHVMGGYFQTLNIPCLRGRGFSESDVASARKVMIVSETLSKRLWGEEDPIGKFIMLDGETEAREVVGCVGDVKYAGLGAAPDPELYLPYSQPLRLKNPPLEATIVLRTEESLDAIGPILRHRVASLDDAIPMFRLKTLAGIVKDASSDYQYRSILLSAFALFSIVLAIAGIYGVISCSVLSRTHEIAVRMSLGCSPRAVLYMIMSEGAELIVIGLCIGTGGFLWAGKLLSALLFGVGWFDLSTILVSVSLIALASLLACARPALAASKINPADALRRL